MSNAGTLSVSSANSLSQPNTPAPRLRPSVTLPAGTRTMSCSTATRGAASVLIAGPVFLMERQLMQHVRKRLGVHQPMFDRHFEQRRRIGVRGRNGVLRDFRRIEAGVDGVADLFRVRANFLQRGPLVRLVGRQAAVHRIDAEREQRVVSGIRARQIEQTLVEEIAVESFEMPDVEHDPVPFGDRTLIQEFGLDDIEEGVGGAARVGEAGQQRMTQGRVAIHVAMSP